MGTGAYPPLTWPARQTMYSLVATRVVGTSKNPLVSS